jgi:hypothetical protein
MGNGFWVALSFRFLFALCNEKQVGLSLEILNILALT